MIREKIGMRQNRLRVMNTYKGGARVFSIDEEEREYLEEENSDSIYRTNEEY